MFTYHLKLALRNLRKNKLFSFLSIGGFAFGFAICMILALFTYREKTVDTNFTNHQSIYRVIDAKRNTPRMDYDLAQKLADKYPDIETVIPLNYSVFGDGMLYLKRVDKDDYIVVKDLISTTNEFFKMFSTSFICGNPEKPFADGNSIILSRHTALKIYGRTDVIGEKMTVSNMYNLTVSAVVDDISLNSSLQADFYLNSDVEEYRFSSMCNNDNCYNPVDLYVLLRKNTQPLLFEDILNSDFPANKSETDSIKLQPLTSIYLGQAMEGNNNKSGSQGMIRLFLAIAILIMLLSVINYINFALTKQIAALKEIGIKITNGAGLNHLRIYYLMDVALAVCISFILALGLTWLFLPKAGNLLGVTLSLQWMVTPALSALFGAILLLVILISSFAPVYILSRFDVQRLFGKKDIATGKQIGRKVLTVFQLTTAMVLLTGLLIIQKQLHFVKSTDLGFNKEHLVRIDFMKKFKSTDMLKEKIAQLPFVQSTTLSYGAPGNVFIGMGSNNSTNEQFLLECIFVDQDFLKTMNIRLIDGREFMNSDQNLSCYLNETAYKKFGWDNYENNVFNNGREGGYRVVGIVNDFNVYSLHNMMKPVCLLYQTNYNKLSIRLQSGTVSQQMAEIRNIWEEVAPGTPFMYTFYDDCFNSFYHKEDQQAKAITIFSIIAFIITCLGLMGQIFQTSQNRIKEIGIRKVNGAKVAEVVMMLNQDFVKWVAVAYLIAVPVSYYAMNQWLTGFSYKTSLNWWVFALSGCIALGIAILTVSWQSWRAATRNPVEALRYE